MSNETSRRLTIIVTAEQLAFGQVHEAPFNFDESCSKVVGEYPLAGCISQAASGIGRTFILGRYPLAGDN